MNSYDRGDTTRLSLNPKDDAGADADPATVRLLIRKPYTDPIVHTYPGGDGAIQRDSVGHYHADVPLDAPGVWRVRWETTGNPQLSESDLLYVRSDSFVGV